MDEDREGSINAMGKIESHSQFAWLGMLVASTCLSWIITRRMVVVSIYIYSQLMRLDGGRVALSKGAAYCASHGLSCLYFGVAPSKGRTRPATDPVAVF